MAWPCCVNAAPTPTPEASVPIIHGWGKKVKLTLVLKPLLFCATQAQKLTVQFHSIEKHISLRDQ